MVPEGMSRVDGTDVGVAFSEVQGPPPPEQAELVRFGEMVARLSATGALLPFRFGTVVEDREALEGLVAEREAEWLERLGAGRNKGEMGGDAGRAATPAPPPPLTRRGDGMS